MQSNCALPTKVTCDRGHAHHAMAHLTACIGSATPHHQLAYLHKCWIQDILGGGGGAQVAGAKVLTTPTLVTCIIVFGN